MIRMFDSDSKNSGVPDNGSGSEMKDVFGADSAKAGDGSDSMTRSVSVLNGYSSDTKDKKTEESLPKGVPIKNFDSLIEHMASLNVKFFN